MKTLLLLLSALAAHAVVIPAAEYAEIRAKIVAMQAAIHDQAAELDAAKTAKDALSESVGNLAQTNASQSAALIATQRETLTAVQETVKVQAAMDAQTLLIEKQRGEIAKQAAKLARWEKFGHAVLLCFYAVVFGYAWQLLGRIPYLITAPYAFCIRAAISMSVAGAACAVLFYGIVHFL